MHIFANPVAYYECLHYHGNQPTAACDDCTKALKFSPDNVKALFRHALAMKVYNKLLSSCC